jgi:hypothetical protein
MAIVDDHIPDFSGDAPVLSFIDEAEARKMDALAALDIPDDEPIAQARARLEECAAMFQRTRAAREQAETERAQAIASHQELLEQRLRGQAQPEAEVAARQCAVSASIELESLIALEQKVGADLKAAETALAEAILRGKLGTAREQWNGLAKQQRDLCIRFTKSLREIKAWHGKLWEGARHMESLAAALGLGVSWHLAERRILDTHLKAAMYGLIRDIEFVGDGKRDIADSRLCDIWPFAKSVDSQTAPGEGEP